MKKTYTQLFPYCYKIFIILLFSSIVAPNAHASKLYNEAIVNRNAATAQTITFNPVAPRTYGDADFTVSASASSGLAVQYRSSNTAIATVNISTGLVHILAPGTFNITASQAGNATYNAAPTESRPVVISKANLIVKVNSQTRVYGVNNAALTVIYDGFKYNDTPTKLSVRPVASTTANIGSGVGSYPITLSQGTSTYYDLTYEGGATITVTQAPLTITAVNKVKAYGAANPALTLTYAGFKNNQNASVLTTPATVTTAVDINTAPGTYAINVSGATASNYAINQVDGTFTVTRGTLNVTATGKNKVYGADVPALTYTITGYVLGQTSSVLTSPVNIATTAAAASTVGTYPITVNGASADNYNITYTQGSLNVSKAALKVTAASVTKIYGQVNPALTYTYAGFVLTDTEANLLTNPAITTTAQTSSPAGSYLITVNGATSNNYNITYTPGKLTIGKAPLRIIADAKTKTYKSANPPLTYTYDGFVGTDNESNLTFVPVITTTATPTSAAGVYPITVKGATAANYAITFVNSTLAVAKADLIIKANDITRTYGATVPAFTFTYTGFVDNDTESVLTRKPIASAPITIRSGAGNYTITPSGAVSLNYNIIYQTGTLTIEKRTLTITAANKTKAYGVANPAFTVTYLGLVNGDRAPAILTGTPDVATTATPASLPGNYPIVISGTVTADNYDIAYANGALTVGKAVLRVIVGNKIRAYGQPNPALTYTFAGFVNGDDASKLTEQPQTPVTTADPTSPAGNYLITVTGGAADNYTFQYFAGRLTITKVQLTATIDAKSKAYGQPNPELTATYTGFVNGDTQASITTGPALATVDANSPVGTYPITGTGGTADNYTFRIVNSTLTITPASLNVKADDATRSYGVANPAFTATYTGLVNGDNVSSAFSTAPTLTTPATITSAQGTYAITPSGGVSSNYTLNYIPGTLTITKAQLFVKADNKDKTYGDANPALTLTYSGFFNGDDESVITTTPVVNVNTDALSNAGTYAITPSGGRTLNDSYDLIYQNGTLTINKAPLTIAAQDATRVYGTANTTFTPVYAGFVNGQTAAVLNTQPAGTTTATANSGVGNYPITFSGAVANNYSFNYTPATLTITQATLTITANNKNRIYGAANPAFDFSYSGFATGDNASNLTNGPTAITPATATSAVGTYAIVPSGAASANYAFVYNNGTLTVDKASLTATADNKNKTYGAANPALTVSYSGFVNGETSSVITTQATASTTATTASGVGNYTIVPIGGAAANYSFVYVNGTLTVGKASLTVVAENKSKVYGTANPAFTYTVNGFVNGDDASALTAQPSGTTTANVNSGVGAYPINFSGATAPNYTFNYTPATLTVTAATLAITANDKARAYGAANPAFDFTYSGFAAGDNENSLTAKPGASTTAVATSAVGTYAIVPSGAASANYTFTYNNGVLTVGKALLTAIPDNKSKIYGAVNPALTVSYTGFVNGDNAASLTTQATAATTATPASAAGTYTITASGATAANYNFTYNTGTLTVDKASLSVIADNKTKAYGAANPTLTYTVNGFVNGDNATALTTQPTAATSATANSATGTYPITIAGAAAANYTFNYTPATLTVTSATLTITANNKTRAYGAANSVFDFTYSGFAAGDNASSLTTGPTATTTATAASAVGTYAIVPSGAALANYTIVYNNGTLTVDKAQLTVTADAKTKVYGSANPALTVNYTGFVNGDNAASLTAQATATTAATSASSVGNYAIAPSGGAAANYNLAYVNGALSVTRATLTITANDQTRSFGQANPAFTFTYSGFVNGDGAASLTTQPTATTTAIPASATGNYPIVAAGAAAANYSFNYANGTLTVTAGSATINFASLPAKTFGDGDFAPGATNTVNEPLVYTSSNTAVATIVNGNIHIVGAGTTVITVAFPATSGYSQTTPVTQLFVVNKAFQVITFNAIPLITRGSSYTIPSATSSSGLPVILDIKDPSIASVQGLTINGLQIGTTTISAFQPGNNNYYAANTVVQTLQVKGNSGNLELQVHQAVSPNGDGQNDVFFIEGIKDHPDNQVTVINRNGVKIYEVKGYDNATRVFDGHSNINGAMQQPGTYFYLIEYMVNGQGRHLTGYFVLKY